MGAEKHKTHSGNWKKGQSGNPSGRPKEPEELKFLKKNLHNAIRKYACEVLGKNYDDLLSEHHRDNLLVHEKMFLTCAEAAIVDGSIKHFEMLYKIIGLNLNTPQKIEIEDVNEDTGLEAIPTDKLEKIQKILETE